MMIIMMWPLCFLPAHKHAQFTVFRSLACAVARATIDYKPTNIVKHWCKQGNKRFTAAISCCCCCFSIPHSKTHTHTHFNSHGARKSIVCGNQFQFDEIIIFYTVENGNLIFSGVLSLSIPSLSLSLALFYFHSLFPPPRQLYLWGESYVCVAALPLPFLPAWTTNIIGLHFLSTRTQNTHLHTDKHRLCVT